MRSTAYSKTSFPVVSKGNTSQGLDTNFRDENLRDPQHGDRSPFLEDLSSHSVIKQASDILDYSDTRLNYDRGGNDQGNKRVAGMSKSQSTLLSGQKQKRLKPLGQTGDAFNTVRQREAGKSTDFGLSDFYLKNFLVKERIDGEGRRILTQSQPHQTDPLSMRSSVMDHKSRSPSKQISAELAQLAAGQTNRLKFFDSLAVSYKEFFLEKKEFVKVFDDIDVAVFCLDEIVERLKCYRFELGSLLEKVGMSYRKIMEKMLDLTMKISSEKDMIHERKMEENFQGIKLLENEKKALEEKNKQYKNLSDVTESEANIYKFNVKSLQNEVSMLYELLKKDYLVQDRIDKSGTEQEQLEALKQFDGGEPSKLLARNLLTLQESIKNLESEQNSKEEKLQEMNNLLKAMLRGGKKEASTQVDEGELAWAAKNILGQDDYKPKAIDYQVHEASSVNVDPHLQNQLEKKTDLEGLDPIDVLKFKEKAEKKEEESQQENIKGQGGKNAGGLQGSAQIVSDNWTLPLSVIVFLENATKANKTANVLPWPFFKRIVFDIYQDRVANTVEVQNVLLNTSVNMSEYLPIYFLKTYRLRRTAEMKLLEFSVSLKYYIKTWQRATTFANVCNISNIKLDVNGVSGSTFPEFDLYAQNFFLFAYSKITTDITSIYDHPDGNSYLVKEKVEDMINDILAFDSEANRKKFIANLSKYYRTFNDNGKEGEGVDVDKMLHFLLETYFEAKTRNNQVLTKHFYKQQSSGEGVFSLDDIFQMAADVIDIESAYQGYSYPKELSVCRAFLYALTSGKNAFTITYKDFIQGIARFGIDCPFPFINLSNQTGANFNTVTSFVISENGPKKNTLSSKNKKASSPLGKNVSGLKPPEIRRPDEDTSSTGSVKIPGLTVDTKDTKKKKEEDKGTNFKIDSASRLFAQHFSIIREIKNYCNQFKDMMSKESDVQKVWKGFDQIVIALDAGCQFLSYPVTL